MFLSKEKVFELTEKYGSPIYVYDENILRKSCKFYRLYARYLKNANYLAFWMQQRG